MIERETLTKKLLNNSWDILIIKKDGSWEFISPDLLDSRDKDTIHSIRRFEYAPISMVKAIKIVREAEIALQMAFRAQYRYNIPSSNKTDNRTNHIKTKNRLRKTHQKGKVTIQNKPLLRKKLMKGDWEIIIFLLSGEWEIITCDLLDSYDNQFIHMIYSFSYSFISIEKVDLVISEIERDIRNKISLQVLEMCEERTLFRLLEGGVFRKN